VTRAEAENPVLPACLTLEQLVNAFAAPLPSDLTTVPSGENRDPLPGPQNWKDLGTEADLPLLVFVPGRSSLETDWLFGAAGAGNRFNRSNGELNVRYDDPSFADGPLYRAAAVANYAEGGGLTLMYWGDYQRRVELENGENAPANKVRLIGLQVGDQCVVPSLETITNGSYPLIADFYVYLSKTSMSNPAAAAFMWNLLSDEVLQAVEDLNLAVFDREALAAQRDELFDLIDTAQRTATQATPEVTPAGTAEATAEGTPAVTPEGTPEATVEVAPEGTPEATPAVTPEATPAATATSGS
jgi:hypothetical protein